MSTTQKVDTTQLELAFSECEVDSIEDTASSKFAWLVATTASVSGMLFGYDAGIISAVLVYNHSDQIRRNSSHLFAQVEHLLGPSSLALQLINMAEREQFMLGKPTFLLIRSLRLVTLGIC